MYTFLKSIPLSSKPLNLIGSYGNGNAKFSKNINKIINQGEKTTPCAEVFIKVSSKPTLKYFVCCLGQPFLFIDLRGNFEILSVVRKKR